MPSARVDVIVTDGFTGNVALKTGEGTAALIRDFLKEAFAYARYRGSARSSRSPRSSGCRRASTPAASTAACSSG